MQLQTLLLQHLCIVTTLSTFVAISMYSCNDNMLQYIRPSRNQTNFRCYIYILLQRLIISLQYVRRSRNQIIFYWYIYVLLQRLTILLQYVRPRRNHTTFCCYIYALLQWLTISLLYLIATPRSSIVKWPYRNNHRKAL